MSIREKVARAICESEDGTDPNHIYWSHSADMAITAFLQAIDEAGWQLARKEPTPEMRHAGHEKMPVEADYWQEGGMLHCEMRPLHKCVQPDGVYRAMLAAQPPFTWE